MNSNRDLPQESAEEVLRRHEEWMKWYIAQEMARLGRPPMPRERELFEKQLLIGAA